MSPSTTDIDRAVHPALAARARAAQAGLRRAWRDMRGTVSRHVVYLHEAGVVAWRTDAAAGAPAAFDTFADWCAANPGADAWLRVAGTLVHSLAVDHALQLRDAASVRRYAQQQFTHYHGPQAAGWPLAVWQDGAQGGACALHGLDLDALRRQAREHDVRLRGVAPVWSAGLDALATARPEFRAAGRHGLLIVEGAAATWLVAEDGIVVTLRQRFLDAPHVDAVARLLASLVRESAPLDARPLLVGWHVEGAMPDSDSDSDSAAATVVGLGAGALSGWIDGTLHAAAGETP